MPTIEIASINSTGLELDQADFKIAIIEEAKLESHRGLFNDFLSTKNGTIVHLGNPDFRNDKNGFYFAGELINWEFPSTTNFKFAKEHQSDIEFILQIALKKSSKRQLFFLTDYQFGPRTGRFKKIDSLKDFWQEHHNLGLIWNTCYEIHQG